MNAVTKASRAAIAEYAKKTLRPYEFGAIGLFVVAALGTAWLIAQVSSWWWLLMIVVLAYGVIGSIVWLIIHYTIDRLRPEQTDRQKRAVEIFISRIDKVADTLGQTRFGLLLRIISDVMRRREQNVISEFAADSTALKDEFEKLIDEFRQ